MEILVPFLIVFLIGTLAVVLYLERRREELAREEALKRRISRFAPTPVVVAGGAPQQVRPRPLPPARGISFTWSMLRYIDRWLAQGGMKITAARFLALVLLMGAGAIALTALWVDRSIAVCYGLAVAALPVAYVHVERKRRLATFSQQLPYLLHPAIS